MRERQMKKTIHLIGLVMLLMALFACSSGGGGDHAPSNKPLHPQGSGNWDEMVWDRDNWS
jgi:hypothetical protein